MISVIVCTFNRSQCLKRLLKSFFEQENLDVIEYELIIVDNNSADDTRSIVKSFMRPSQVHYVFEKRIGLSIARNRGIALAKGEIVAFLDDDVIVGPDWLPNLQKCFQETDADVVGGRSHLLMEKEEPVWLGPFFKICLSQVDLGNERMVLCIGDRLFGLNLSIHKSAFQLVGKFNEQLGRHGKDMIGGEEADLLKRISSLQKKIVYDPDVIVNHIIDPRRLEWDYFVAHAIGTGETKALSERRCKWPYQLLRIGNSLSKLIKSTFKLIRANHSHVSPYGKRMAEWEAIKDKSHLICRWKQLWGNQLV